MLAAALAGEAAKPPQERLTSRWTLSASDRSSRSRRGRRWASSAAPPPPLGSIALAAVAGSPYLSFSSLNPWIAVFAVSSFVALFAVPFAVNQRIVARDPERAEAWERAMMVWGAVALGALAFALVLIFAGSFSPGDSLADAVGLLIVIETGMVLASSSPGCCRDERDGSSVVAAPPQPARGAGRRGRRRRGHLPRPARPDPRQRPWPRPRRRRRRGARRAQRRLHARAGRLAGDGARSSRADRRPHPHLPLLRRRAGRRGGR